LIIEKLKGDESFYKPFFDSLPEKNETLFTLLDSTPIKQGSKLTLLGEIERKEDDILNKVKLGRDTNDECLRRFRTFLE
jgi:hypothetical protein